MVIIYLRCSLCGSPIIKHSKGPPPQYCKTCLEQSRRDTQVKRKRKERKIKRENIKSYIRMFEYEYTEFDENGKQRIDYTHASPDVYFTPYGKREFLGTVSERDLNKFIAKRYSMLKKQKRSFIKE